MHARHRIDRDAVRVAGELASRCWRGVCNRLLEHGYHLVKVGSPLSCTGDDIVDRLFLIEVERRKDSPASAPGPIRDMSATDPEQQTFVVVTTP